MQPEGAAREQSPAGALSARRYSEGALPQRNQAASGCGQSRTSTLRGRRGPPEVEDVVYAKFLQFIFVIASAAKQSSAALRNTGLLRCARNDEGRKLSGVTCGRLSAKIAGRLAACLYL